MNGLTVAYVKYRNYNIIWQYLIKEQKATIKEIADKINLSVPTVTRVIEYGKSINMICEEKFADSTGGRKAQVFSINKSFACSMTAVVNNKTTYCRILDFACNVLEEYEITADYNQIASVLENAIKSAKAKRKELEYVAICCSGVAHKGKIIDWIACKKYNGFEMSAYLEKECGVRVVYENNMKALTLAQKKKIENVENETVVCFQYGNSGYGSGILLNGELLRGADGFAGEISYLPVAIKYETNINACAKLIVSMIAVVNPNKAVLYLKDSEDKLDKLIKAIEKYIPSYAMPSILLGGDFVEDCHIGLQQMNIESQLRTLDLEE